jgi:hypothetical protein
MQFIRARPRTPYSTPDSESIREQALNAQRLFQVGFEGTQVRFGEPPVLPRILIADFRRLTSGYVSAIAWKELTTSSGPFSVKKLS